MITNTLNLSPLAFTGPGQLPATYPYARQMPNPTDFNLIVLLDRSGSMGNIRADMEGGLDAFLKEQSAIPGCKLTLVQFDNVVETVYDRIPLELVPRPPVLDPRGGTALLDAIGRTLTHQAERIGEGRVAVLIITDGQENCSIQWKRDDIRSLITRLTEQRGWVVSYLGANVDAFSEARSLGIDVSTTSDYSANAAGVKSMMALASNKMAAYRTANTDFSFTDDERIAMGGKEQPK